MDAILEFAEQCADADAAKIEQLMSMMFYDWTTEAKLGYIDREMCIKYNRVDNYWWLPPAFRLTDEWPMWQKHMVEMCRKNAFRCWEKFWRTQVADRKDAVAQIYWSNLMLPEVVRRDFSDYLRQCSSRSCAQIIVMLNDMCLLRKTLRLRKNLALRFWDIARGRRYPPIAMLRETLPFTDDQSMAEAEDQSVALWRLLRRGKSTPTPHDKSRLAYFVELYPAMMAVLIGGIAGRWLRPRDDRGCFRDKHRFFIIAIALPDELQLHLAAVACGTRVSPRAEDLRLVAGAILE